MTHIFCDQLRVNETVILRGHTETMEQNEEAKNQRQLQFIYLCNETSTQNRDPGRRFTDVLDPILRSLTSLDIFVAWLLWSVLMQGKRDQFATHWLMTNVVDFAEISWQPRIRLSPCVKLKCKVPTSRALV
jgi:hypothetical protein